MPNNNEVTGTNEDILSPDDFDIEDNQGDESETDDNVEQVDGQDETSNTADEDDENVKTQEELEAAKKAKAEAKKNSYYAQKRREREAAEKAQKEKEIREKAKLEAELELVKVNPYTNEKIVDEEDLKIYKLQKAIEEKGGDPLSDLPKALAEENRKEAQRKKALIEKDQATQQKLAEEANELYSKHPEAVGQAEKDQELLDLITEKNGRWTMNECYEYLQQKRNTEKTQKAKTQNETKKKEVVGEAAKKYNKTPSSQPNGSKNSEKSVLSMTDEEFNQYWKSKYAN